jgi:cystathionine beta-lyase
MGYNSLGAMEHDLKLETLLQHLGEETPFPYGSVTPPIVQTTLFTAPSLRMRQEHGGLNDAGYVYTRESNPTVRLAEQKLAALEQTEDALCFASGMAAIASAILTFTRTGDHVICVESAYPPTRMLLESWLTRYGVQASFIEGKCPEEFERMLQPNTRLIYLESPSSLVFHLQDLRAVSQLARACGILTLCDNSWATPIFQNPHALGIDLVLHSASKYLGGHSDLLAGVVAGRREHIEQVRQTRSLLGGVLEPFGAWLLLRGLRTLPVRMERAHKSGLQVAEWLEAQPQIAQVNHPGLPSHPQHALARQQMRGYSSLFSFETRPIYAEQAYAFADRLRLFQFGCSWGGYESLLLGWQQGDADPAPWLFRIYIGLENPDDLIRDLQQALPALSGVDL